MYVYSLYRVVVCVCRRRNENEDSDTKLYTTVVHVPVQSFKGLVTNKVEIAEE
jgi:large subunit ribosomal protein L31e